MADEFAIIDFTVPSSTGTQDYTSGSITDWSTAIIVIAGNSDDETEGGRMTVVFLDEDGTYLNISSRMLEGVTSSTDNVCGPHTNAIRICDDDPSPGIGSWAIADFDSDLGNGFRLNWTSVSGVSGRTFNGFAILIGGVASHRVSISAPDSGVGFEADMVLSLSSISTIVASPSVGNDAGLSLGAVLNDGSDTQASAAYNSERLLSTATGLARTDTSDYAQRIVSPSVFHSLRANTFTGTGFTETLTNGTPPRAWMALAFSDAARTGLVAVEELDGTTGSQSFTGLGGSPIVVLGMIVGCASNDTLESGTDEQSLAVFATDGTNTYCASMSHLAGSVGVGTPTEAFSRWADGSISMLADDGTTAFAATVTGLSGGLQLNVSTGFTGRMLLIGWSQVLTSQGVSETETISEVVGFARTMARTVSETVEIADQDDLASVLVQNINMDGPAADSTIAGPHRADSSIAGAVAADDGSLSC